MAMILGRRHVLDLVDLPRATNRFSWASPGNPCFRLRTHVSWIPGNPRFLCGSKLVDFVA